MLRTRALPAAVASLLALAAYLAPGLAPARAARAPANAAGAAPSCAFPKLGVSQALAGNAVTVTPAPDSMDASHLTQISFLGVPAATIGGVNVSGSRSGVHVGRLQAYSQGDGASFLPSRPFVEGETVTVHAILRENSAGRPFSWHFTIADNDSVSRSLETPPPPPPKPKPGEVQRYVSRPDLQPPAVTVGADESSSQASDIFLAPYAGPGQYGPMILEGDGSLAWFKPIPTGSRAADLRVQAYEGKPVLTWWQDPLVAGGQRDAGVVIADDAYRDIQIVRAANGYQPDLHAFEITPQGTALFTVYDAIRCDLSAYGGPADGAVADSLFQEIDLRTGLVRYEWHALDHVPLSASYEPIGHGGTPVSPWDYFHINAISVTGPDLLVDSRNTWAAYEVSARSGQVEWQLGGKRSSFKLAPDASPAWQHDAREGPGNTISFFDNGGTPKVHAQSRVIVLALDRQTMTAKLISSFVHPSALLAASQGDFQPLPGGDWFVGWGQEPFFSEYSPSGRLLFDAHLPAAYQSYTVLRYPWTGQPTQPPVLAVKAGAGGKAVAYVSWNGATAVTTWRLLGGSDKRRLTPVQSAPRHGFETAIPLTSAFRYLAAQALNANGAVLGATTPVAVDAASS